MDGLALRRLSASLRLQPVVNQTDGPFQTISSEKQRDTQHRLAHKRAVSGSHSTGPLLLLEGARASNLSLRASPCHGHESLQ